MKLNAYAKINWDLYVLGKRPDGFHELDTVMVTVGLADELDLEPADDLTLTCSDPALPCDGSNLIVKAARALAEKAGVEPRARMHVTKRVPAGGGMGGGSADAAATLVGLNQLWRLNWPKDRLAEVAGQLGSDVAFFLWGGWCRCRGRGEIVEPLTELASLVPFTIWLIIPAYSVPTPPVYKALRAKPLDESCRHRTLTEVVEAVRLQSSRLVLSSACNFSCSNDLLHASQETEPRLRGLVQQLEDLFPGRWHLSGSGAVHFVVPSAGMRVEDARRALNQTSLGSLKVLETATRAF